MKLQTYWRSLDPEGKDAFAKRAGTSVGYLHVLAGNHQRPGPELAKKLVQASDGKLQLAMLRPDLWGDTAA
jgi:hypothetical protein